MGASQLTNILEKRRVLSDFVRFPLGNQAISLTLARLAATIIPDIKDSF